MHREAGQREQFPARTPPRRCESGGEVIADHGVGCLLGCDAASVELGGHPAVAQDGGAVGDLADLVHPVRDVDDPGAVAAQFGDHREQPVHLGTGQRRGRLVHDQHRGVLGQRAGDGDQLLLADAELSHGAARVEIHPDAPQQFTGPQVHPGTVHSAACGAGLASEVEVLCDRQRGHQIQLLLDHGDPGALRVDRPAESAGFPGDADLAGMAGDIAGQHPHEGGLARTVLAEQRVNLTGPHGQVHARTGQHTTEPFRDRP
ncbi:hypothetical protein J2S53_002249 [Actinopolyspora lacussalsi]|nr:hypothetical protein [Actinopolyspora lacussalsi]